MNAKYNDARKFLRRQLTRSFRDGREQWWLDKCREMEKAGTTGNKHDLY